MNTRALETTWSELHQLSVDEIFINRADAVVYFGKMFSLIPDELKAAAWDDIHRLTKDEHTYVRECAAYSIGSAISSIFNEYKVVIWKDLHRLAREEFPSVRAGAANAIGFSFSYVPDEYKDEAWNDLHRLSKDTSIVKLEAVIGISFAYSSIPDKYKEEALDDLLILIYNENKNIRERVAYAIGYIFSSIPNEYKERALYALKILRTNDHEGVLNGIAYAIRIAFSSIPYQYQSEVLYEICSLKNDSHWKVRESVAYTISDIFSAIPDQYQNKVLDEICSLKYDSIWKVRESVAYTIGHIFPYISNQNKLVIFDSLCNLKNDSNWEVRKNVTYAIGTAFSAIPDQYQNKALDEICSLKNDSNWKVRESVAYTIGHIFPYISNQNKLIIFDSLCSLKYDSVWKVRESVAYTIGIVFSAIPDQCKHIAWSELYLFTFDIDFDVRANTAKAIGIAFPSIPDKYKHVAWNILKDLSHDFICTVRIYAKHSLGKISIHKASISDNDNDTRDLVKMAISFFESAVNESGDDNPAKFCNLIYHTINVILFDEIHSYDEVHTYIKKAKKEIKGSKSKQDLIEAFEQLDNVFRMAQSARENNIDIQVLLQNCVLICAHVDQLMLENKNKTPALYNLFKKKKPSFDNKIKIIFKDLKETAKVACQDSTNTPAKYVACSINQKIQNLSFENPATLENSIDLIIFSIDEQVPDIPKNKNVRNKINEAKNCSTLLDKTMILSAIIQLLPKVHFQKEFDDFKEEVKNGFDKVYESQHRIELSLEQVHQKLDKSLDKLHTLSLDFKTHGKEIESEYIDTFENEIRTLITERDSETLDLFAQKLFQNRSLLLDANDKSDASDEEKKESEKSIFELKDLPRKIKDIMKSATTDVSKEVVVSLIANLIIESVFPILGPASSQIVKVLVSAIRSRNKSNKLY